MTTRTVRNAGRPISGRGEKIQDFLLVSSFGLWATVLGMAPVLAFRLLMGS
jgi:hypothetical protein